MPAYSCRKHISCITHTGVSQRKYMFYKAQGIHKPRNYTMCCVTGRVSSRKCTRCSAKHRFSARKYTCSMTAGGFSSRKCVYCSANVLVSKRSSHWSSFQFKNSSSRFMPIFCQKKSCSVLNNSVPAMITIFNSNIFRVENPKPDTYLCKFRDIRLAA